jgi:hypothetical protein
MQQGVCSRLLIPRRAWPGASPSVSVIPRLSPWWYGDNITNKQWEWNRPLLSELLLILTTNLLLVLNTKIWVRPVWHAQKACSRSIDDDVRIHRCRCWAKTCRYVSLIQCDRLCVLSHFAGRHYAWQYRFSIARVVLHGVHHARRDIARYAHYCGNLLAADANGNF